MPYIGHSPTNAGSFVELDDISSGFNGSTAGFTMQVGGVSVTPSIENLLICLDGVVQQPTSAFSISGSTITFTENVPSGTDFYGILMGQSATVGQGTITASEMAVTGNGTNGQLLKTDGDGTFTWIDQNTVTAPASGLQGNTLASGVTASSLTSVGTLTGLTTGAITQNAGTLTIKNASSDSNGLKIYQDSSDASKIYNHYNGTLQLGVGSTTAITIDSSENTTFAGDVTLGTKMKLIIGSTSEIKHDDGSGSLTLMGDQVNIKNRAGDETGLSYNDGGGVILSHNSKATSSSADTTFKIETTSGSTIFPVLDFVSSHSSVGGKIRQDGSDVISIDNDQDVTFADDVTVSGLLEVDGSYLQVDNGGVRIDRHSNPPYILMEYDGTGVAQLRGVSGGGLNITNGGAGTTWQSFDSSGNATFNQNIITKSESNHTFTSSGTDNVAIKRQVWYSSYSSHNFQLSTTDSGSAKYLILSTLGSNGHIDWKISGSRMSQVYASITFTNYADASGRTAYLEWSDDEGQNWNTVDTHGSWGAGSATVSATINTANGSSQTGGSSSGSSSGSNQIIIRGRFVGGGGSYIGITNVTIKPTASYWTFISVPRGYYNTTVSGITASTKTVQGTWTKTGRQVFIQAYITIDGKSGGSGNPYIALPFTPSDIGVPASTVGANIHKNTSISNLVYFGLYGANAQIYANNGNGGYIGHSDWANGVVGFTLTYNAL